MGKVQCWGFLIFLLSVALCIPAQSSECYLAPEIVLVQDITYSYQASLDTLGNVMPHVFDMLQTHFPGTKFGVVTFQDSAPCGYSNDYCAYIQQSLLSAAARDMAATQKIFQKLRSTGGKDLPEDPIGAAIRTVLSPQVGFSPPDVVYNDLGQPIIRIMMLTTDCVYHLPGDKEKCSEEKTQFPESLPLDDPNWLKDDINAGCTRYDYASVDMLRKVLEERKVTPIFLWGRGTAWNTRHTVNETFNYDSYIKFTKKYGYRNRKEFFDPHFEYGLTNLMKTLFKDEYNWEPITETVDDKMTGFVEKLKNVMTEAVERKCIEISTTSTAAPIVPTSSTITNPATPVPATSGAPVPATSGAPVPATSGAPVPATSGAPRTTNTAPALSTEATSAGQGGETSAAGGGEGGSETSAAGGGGGGRTTTTKTEAAGGPPTGVIIGAASGGVAAVAAAAGGSVKLYKMFGSPNTPQATMETEAEIPETEVEREAYEPVTVDLFT